MSDDDFYLIPETIECPGCGASIQYPRLPTSTVPVTCLACHRIIVNVALDAIGHNIAEIDTSMEYTARGTLRIHLYTLDQKICFVCAHCYPKELSACPELIRDALGWYFDTEFTHSTCNLVLKFLGEHIDVLNYIDPDPRISEILKRIQ